MTATILSTLARSPAPTSPSDNSIEPLKLSIRAHEERARQAAEQGDLSTAARFILAALDGERRMAAKGPQVLQLIKPRS